MRKELQTKDHLLSENEISELFCNQENISSSYNVMNSILKISILEPAMQQLQKMLFGEDGMSGY